MNNSDIIALTFDLKDKIIDSELYKDMKEKEKKMMENEECSYLLNEFQKLKGEYEEAKRFEKYGSDVGSAQKKLSEVKYKLDENAIVKEYNLAYKKMRRKIKEIEKILFKDIIEKKKEIDIKEE